MQKLKAYFAGKQNPRRQNQLDQLELSDNIGKPKPSLPVLQNPDSQKKLKDSLQNAFGTPKTSRIDDSPQQLDEEALSQILALRNLNGRNS